MSHKSSPMSIFNELWLGEEKLCCSFHKNLKWNLHFFWKFQFLVEGAQIRKFEAENFISLCPNHLNLTVHLNFYNELNKFSLATPS